MSLAAMLTSQLSDVAPLVQSRQVSSTELTRATLEAINEVNPRSGSYISIVADVALAEAQRADAEIASGMYRGPIHGIPYSIKDNIATRGIVSTAGSIILKDYVPTYDSTVATRTRAAGGVLVGKNNLHEWASGGTNDNPHFGRAGNSWALDRIPGGSSGGSAAAVSLGLGSFSFGTDGAGSVRLPASLCGVVGIKATYALISRYGMLPPVAPGQDHGPGILARSIKDAAHVMDAIVGYDAHDPAAFAFEPPGYAASLDREVKGLKACIPANYYFDLIDPEVEAEVRAAISVVGSLGVELEEARIPFLDEAMAVSYVGTSSEFHKANLRTRRQDYGDDLRYRFMAQQFTLAKDATRAAKVRDIFKASMRKLLNEYDVLLAPTVCLPAYPFDAPEVQIGTQTVQITAPGASSDVLVRLTRPANVAGVPAVSVPCGMTTSGLPIGLQVIGKPLGEATLFALAHQYGVATGQTVCSSPRQTLAAAVS